MQPLAWRKMCKLDLRRIRDIIRASVPKQFWYLMYDKSSLWSSWMLRKYTKHVNLSDALEYNNSSLCYEAWTLCNEYIVSVSDTFDTNASTIVVYT